jgi:hypothetical protein
MLYEDIENSSQAKKNWENQLKAVPHQLAGNSTSAFAARFGRTAVLQAVMSVISAGRL